MDFNLKYGTRLLPSAFNLCHLAVAAVSGRCYIVFGVWSLLIPAMKDALRCIRFDWTGQSMFMCVYMCVNVVTNTSNSVTEITLEGQVVKLTIGTGTKKL